MENDTTDTPLLDKALGGLVRCAGAAIGGGLVSHGLVSADLMQQVMGALSILVPMIWSAWSKIKAERARIAALHAIPPALVVPMTVEDRERLAILHNEAQQLVKAPVK